jgi:hypothetical protein
MNIIIPKKVNFKLKYFVELTSGEISGIGKSHVTEDRNIMVDDFIIFKQTCSGSLTTIDDEAQAQFMFDLMKKNEKLSNWNIWWHSHANMQVFWSTTDDKTISDHRHQQDYLISIVTNKAEQFKARIDVFPKENPAILNPLIHTIDLDVQVEEDFDEKIFDHCMKEIEEKITVKEFFLPKRNYLEPAYDDFVPDNGIPKKKKGKKGRKGRHIQKPKKPVSKYNMNEDDREYYAEQTGFQPAFGEETRTRIEDLYPPTKKFYPGQKLSDAEIDELLLPDKLQH